MNIPFIGTKDEFTIYLKGQCFTSKCSDSAHNRVLQAIKDGKDENYIYDILTSQDTESYLQDSNGKIVYKNGELYMNGDKIPKCLADRVIDFKNNGLPVKYLLNFITRIENNPSYNSRQQLYSFLEYKNLVICENGCFLAYKAITKDYLDKYTKTIDNSIGRTISMNRDKIDDNPNNHCSSGLHVGSIEYVREYKGENDKIVIVEVDPANVVSVPNDYSCQKCRVCQYKVLQDFQDVMTVPLYTTDGQPYKIQTEVEIDFIDNMDDCYDEADVYSYDDEDDGYDDYYDDPDIIELD